MEWVSNKRPNESGKYLVSINKEREHGSEGFNYVAYYDHTVNKWYKHDPFDENYTPKEEIEDRVIGWAYDVGVYIK